MLTRPIRFLVRAFLSWTIALTVTAVTVYLVAIRPLQRSWGVDPGETTARLSGDEVIEAPTIIETRGITIAAPPSAVWPWLVQMGYGRGGWYSYDRLDTSGGSTDSVLPEYQSLAVGDIVPTHPSGGFRVASIEPERSLVLYLDTALVREQAEAAQAEAARPAASDAVEATPAGLRASGAMGGMTMPEFRASWSFVLEPVGETSTRLIERFRVSTPEPGRAQRVGLPLMGLGVFLMTRRQMLGIKERAERGPVTPMEDLSAAA